MMYDASEKRRDRQTDRKTKWWCIIQERRINIEIDRQSDREIDRPNDDIYDAS
jgi:hypothetical protein